MSQDGLSAAGSSLYSSNTLHVGDGTWDNGRDTFLLPNLVGLNFNTMRYNGMGNRFAALPGYHGLIRAHGAIAFILFLVVVPSAIFIMRFGKMYSTATLRIHVWLHIFTVFMLTVVLILGCYAVGPERSLTNPHHGIGVAIYTLVLVQFLGGYIVRRMERNRDGHDLSVKTMLHHWLGRAIALLGMAQIPLGLTLYGAPKGYFVLYALVASAWVIFYFVCSHRFQSNRNVTLAESHSFYSRPPAAQPRHNSHFLRNTALVGGAFAGINALRNRQKRRSRSREDSTIYKPEVTPKKRRRYFDLEPDFRPTNHHVRHDSHVSLEEDEKYAQDQRPVHEHHWRNRILGAGVGLALFQGFKRVFGRKQTPDDVEASDTYETPSSPSYERSHGDTRRSYLSRSPRSHAPQSPTNDTEGPHTLPSATYDSPLSSPSRVGRNQRRPIQLPQEPRYRRRDSFSSVSSINSYDEVTKPASAKASTATKGFLTSVAAISGFTYLRKKWNQKGEQTEPSATEALSNNRNHDTHRHRGRSPKSPYAEDLRRRPPIPLSPSSGINTIIPPLAVSAAAIVAADTSNRRIRPSVDESFTPGYPLDNASLTIPVGPGPPPLAPISEAAPPSILYDPGHSNVTSDLLVKPVSGPVVPQDDESTSTMPGVEPPVSVKILIHDDHRHVTLRRLNTYEAAAEREARRRERRARRLNESLDSVTESEFDNSGYRRLSSSRARPQLTSTAIDDPMGQAMHDNVPGMDPALLPAIPIAPSPVVKLSPNRHSRMYQPLPPPVPVHGKSTYKNSPSSMAPSPTGPLPLNPSLLETELSAFEDNRRRRRAERAAALAGSTTNLSTGMGSFLSQQQY